MSPIRMCIACRKRFEQGALHRLQCENDRVVAYQKRGRSFYLCAKCVASPKLSKLIARHCKTKEPSIDLIESLKEKTD